MNNIICNNCYDSAEYVEKITGIRPTETITLEMLENMELDFWNYPLTEIDHIIENNLKVILVRFPDMYGGYDYRFCEVVDKENETSL